MLMNRSTKIMMCFVAFSVAGLAVSDALSREGQPGKVDYRQLVLFRKVVDKIQKDYVREVEDKELMSGAINGMLRSLDPYSSYLDEGLFKELHEASDNGQPAGVGIEMAYENEILTIVSPIEDSPAFKAGLQAGDKITEIDGESTKGMTVLDAVKKLRGPKGTKVTITVFRIRKKQDFVVTRDVVHVPSLKAQLLEKGYAYIRLASFQDTTAKEVTSAINKFSSDGALKGVVLDLRNNSAAVPPETADKVASLFMDKGLITYTDGRVKDQPESFWVTRPGEHYDFKLAVLVDHGSAGPAEVLAGSLQDYSRALLFGTRSFGRALVQTTIPLEDGGALRLTTAYYCTPRGRNIQKHGIRPDVDLTKELDKQRRKNLAKEDQGADDKKKKPSPQNEKLDPSKDLMVGEALTWLKKDQTVQEYKIDTEAKNKQGQAWYQQDTSEEQSK